MQTLTDKLFETLTDKIRLGVTVESIEKDGSEKMTVHTAGTSKVFDAIVISTPAHTAASIVEKHDPALAQKLLEIYYPPIAVVYAAYRSDQIKSDTTGFGFLVPGTERRNILGSLWTSSVFRGRVPAGSDYRLFTTFVGGSRNPAIVDLPDDKLIQTVVDELASILGIEGEPEFIKVKKWEKAIPQYNLGYEDLYDAIDAFRASNSRVFFCSNFYKGISVSDCVKNAIATTNSVLDLLES
jgi:oxygen-dependent protoporphyrinogen oxidase